MFTAAQMYEWDEPKRSDRKPAGSVVDDRLLEPLLRGGPLGHWLDPRRSAGSRTACGPGRPPRSADEMAEQLRLLGDLTASKYAGRWRHFLAELE